MIISRGGMDSHLLSDPLSDPVICVSSERILMDG